MASSLTVSSLDKHKNRDVETLRERMAKLQLNRENQIEKVSRDAMLLEQQILHQAVEEEREHARGTSIDDIKQPTMNVNNTREVINDKEKLKKENEFAEKDNEKLKKEIEFIRKDK